MIKKRVGKPTPTRRGDLGRPKKNRQLLVFIIIFICSTVYALETEICNYNGYRKNVVKGEIIVKFKTDVNESLKITAHNKYSTVRKNKLDLSIPGKRAEFELIKLPPGMSVDEAIEVYSSLDEVESVQPNNIYHAFVTPDDPNFDSQWGLRKIFAPQAWDTVKGSSDVIISVVDTGVDYNHEDLAPNVLSSGKDYANNDSDAMDDNGHGTHVAGIIAALGNNSIGIAGVSWYSKILPVKVLDEDGVGVDYDVSQGIRYAADNGANIINMSFGDTLYPPSGSDVLESACQYAYNEGCLLVCASGNGYEHDRNEEPIAPRYDAVSYPAAFSECIAVGAIDSDDSRASFSNYGPELDVVAPGVGILSTVPIDGYVEDNGTSMATPFVCGIAALILSESPGLTNAELKASLRDSSNDIGFTGFDIYTGYGRINASAAVTYNPPPQVALAQNYPNPFNPDDGEETTIVVPQSIVGTSLEVKIYNLAGEQVYTKQEEFGSYYTKWAGKNNDGDVVASGIYFYTLKTNKGTAKGKLTLLK